MKMTGESLVFTCRNKNYILLFKNKNDAISFIMKQFPRDVNRDLCKTHDDDDDSNFITLFFPLF